jgi:hypothetical protein
MKKGLPRGDAPRAVDTDAAKSQQRPANSGPFYAHARSAPRRTRIQPAGWCLRGQRKRVDKGQQARSRLLELTRTVVGSTKTVGQPPPAPSRRGRPLLISRSQVRFLPGQSRERCASEEFRKTAVAFPDNVGEQREPRARVLGTQPLTSGPDSVGVGESSSRGAATSTRHAGLTEVRANGPSLSCAVLRLTPRARRSSRQRRGRASRGGASAFACPRAREAASRSCVELRCAFPPTPGADA